PLTAWVLDRGLEQCSAWRADRSDLAVSVNVSATNLMDMGFVDLVRTLISRHRLAPSALILEITETTIVRDFARCKRVIAQLRDIGVAVSIDDFGAGFTSLAYLANLAVNELKLDRTLISGINNAAHGRDMAVVRGTIELGHALGLRVVAEGIEDDAALAALASIGCDVGQGYFISKPVPAEDLTSWPCLVAEPARSAALRAS
ncbi:MAG TPA: EAL domain-containing protein, partial [Candidatus Dormibacteraeota bacterium]|nr:EAL domain-containing protein [Candidatus Dormibacteraeota bacterium]